MEAFDSGFGGSRNIASLNVPVPVTTLVSTTGSCCFGNIVSDTIVTQLQRGRDAYLLIVRDAVAALLVFRHSDDGDLSRLL